MYELEKTYPIVTSTRRQSAPFRYVVVNSHRVFSPYAAEWGTIKFQDITDTSRYYLNLPDSTCAENLRKIYEIKVYESVKKIYFRYTTAMKACATSLRTRVHISHIGPNVCRVILSWRHI